MSAIGQTPAIARRRKGPPAEEIHLTRMRMAADLEGDARVIFHEIVRLMRHQDHRRALGHAIKGAAWIVARLRTAGRAMTLLAVEAHDPERLGPARDLHGLIAQNRNTDRFEGWRHGPAHIVIASRLTAVFPVVIAKARKNAKRRGEGCQDLSDSLRIDRQRGHLAANEKITG